MKPIDFKPIDEHSFNDRLANLYGAHLPALYTAIEAVYEQETPALPLLLELPDPAERQMFTPWEQADLKVMIFGRETNNWNDNTNRGTASYRDGKYNFNISTSDELLAEIRGKHASEDEVYGITDIYISYLRSDNTERTPFTKRIEAFTKKLQEIYPNKKVGMVWNNLFKMGKSRSDKGKSRGSPSPVIREIEMKYFNVVAEEVKILSPDIVLFMTGEGENGVSCEKVIRDKFSLSEEAFTHVDAFEQPDNEWFFRRIRVPGVRYAALTRHPGPLSLNNDEFNEYARMILDDIQSIINK